MKIGGLRLERRVTEVDGATQGAATEARLIRQVFCTRRRITVGPVLTRERIDPNDPLAFFPRTQEGD